LGYCAFHVDFIPVAAFADRVADQAFGDLAADMTLELNNGHEDE